MKKWDELNYQKIREAKLDGDELVAVFRNGDSINLPLVKVLPVGSDPVNAILITYNEYELHFDSNKDTIVVPWDRLRVLTDPDFAKEMAAKAEEHAQQVGARLKNLRERKGIKSNELAERAGVTPQTITRIEKGYTDVSFATLRKILAAMGYTLKDLANEELASERQRETSSFKTILRKLNKAGIDATLVRKILPAEILQILESKLDKIPSLLADEVSFYLNRIFGWDKNEIWKENDFEFVESPAQFAYFKTPSKGNITQIKAYSHYAYYIANIVRKANIQEPSLEYPESLEDCKEIFLQKYRTIEFENLVNFAWDLGIPVIPLNDSGIFHGASWNIDNNHVIVLKQKTESHARWTFDLLHELYHVFAHLEKPNTSIVEMSELNPYENDSPEEAEANTFSNQFIFEKNSEGLINRCLQLADYRMESLKKAVTEISEDENIPADYLANYLAFRLQLGGKNWWGTAQSFQKISPSPSSIAAKVLKERIQLQTIDPIDRNLLATAIEN
ncbi:helix-turn-helix domain-containing protein [Chitinophaga sp. GbtcB8]|uniref:helix-turn-helix domain-containing protein n=1 Tax=Chitinophaga sp. GbtcB8 TaxID=2824753 RepID=UPI001C307F5E|nr:XRE family transcriptional regulator [Chitinophaga sp. GbtcB8]